MGVYLADTSSSRTATIKREALFHTLGRGQRDRPSDARIVKHTRLVEQFDLGIRRMSLELCPEVIVMWPQMGTNLAWQTSGDSETGDPLNYGWVVARSHCCCKLPQSAV